MNPNLTPPPVPNYQQQQQPPLTRHSNALAIWGLILAFLIPPIGFIISLIALSQAKKRGGSHRGLALAGTIIGACLMVLHLLVLIAFFFYGLPFFQKAYRDTQRQQDVVTLRDWLEEYSADNEDQLPDEDTFAEEVLDLNFIYYNSLTEVVDSNADDEAGAHILYVRDGQPTGDTYYPNLDSLHVWGGSQCGSEAPSTNEDTYAADTIEAASPEDWAIVYRVEFAKAEGEYQTISEGFVCEDRGTVYRPDFDF